MSHRVNDKLSNTHNDTVRTLYHHRSLVMKDFKMSIKLTTVISFVSNVPCWCLLILNCGAFCSAIAVNPNMSLKVDLTFSV